MAGLDDGPSGSGQVDANGDPIWIQRDDEGNRIGDSSDDELQRLRGLYLRMVDPELHARARLQYLRAQQPPPSSSVQVDRIEINLEPLPGETPQQQSSRMQTALREELGSVFRLIPSAQ